ncbi:MAG: ribonuclease III [Candidatus Melainabacteria bacterium]|nr:MAG: ribonuclease III [Candidatus Melainabacteria bacterium]
MLLRRSANLDDVDQLPLRMLANLGDAVSGLYERERAIFSCASAKQMHRQVKERVNAKTQADLLDQITDLLNEKELNLVRRARNLKTAHHRKSDQSFYRKATAFEALIGYLYMADVKRLNELFEALDRIRSGQERQPES